MNTKDAKKIVSDFTRNMPFSSMALCYLFEKGRTQVMETSEADYSAAVDTEIAKAEANGGIYFLSKNAAMKVFRYAKELAAVDDPIDLIALIGNEAYSERYLEMRYGKGAFLATRPCPRCGSSVFFQDEDNEEVVSCCECGKIVPCEPED